VEPVEANLHRPERQVEPLSDCGVLEILHVPQSNQLTVATGQSAESAMRELAPTALARLTAAGRLTDVVERGALGPAAVGNAAAQAEGLVVSDARDPSAWRIGAVAASPGAPGANDRLLRCVFGVLP
jgi:hypothetical protein